MTGPEDRHWVQHDEACESDRLLLCWVRLAVVLLAARTPREAAYAHLAIEALRDTSKAHLGIEATGPERSAAVLLGPKT